MYLYFKINSYHDFIINFEITRRLTNPCWIKAVSKLKLYSDESSIPNYLMLN